MLPANIILKCFESSKYKSQGERKKYGNIRLGRLTNKSEAMLEKSDCKMKKIE